jgi:hypothetical protein
LKKEESHHWMGGVSLSLSTTYPAQSPPLLSLILCLSIVEISSNYIHMQVERRGEGEKTMMERAESATASALMRATSSRLHV